MIHLNLDPAPVAKGEVVALAPEAEVKSLGEIRLTGGRRFQIRRTTALATGRSRDYLVDVQGNAFLLEAVGRGVYGATSRNTGKSLTQNALPARFRFVGDLLILA